MLDIATLGLRVDARQVRDGDRALQDLGRTGARTEGQIERVSGAMKRIAAAAAAAAAAIGLIEAVKLADEMALLDARLKLVTKGMSEFAQAQRDVYEIAQKNAASIQSVTNLYTKLADPIRAVGGGVKEIKGIVDAFSMSLRISGASSEESAAAITQFAQAMGAGKLSGDEFQSMAEASPRFMKALAEGMGVPIGQLKALGGEGKLTADIVGNSLIKALDQLNKEAATMPQTVGGAWTRIKNDIAVSIRDINELEITGGMAGMLDEMRKLIPTVKDELVGAFTEVGKWLDTNRERIAEVWDITKSLVGDLWEVVKGAGQVVGFLAQWALQSGIVKTIFETLRFMVAGFQDGVLLIGAGFAKIGSVIMESVLKPMNVMGNIAANIMEVFDPERAAALRASMKVANDFAGAGGKYFDEVMDRFARGDTAVGKLDREMSGVKLTTEAAGKAAEKTASAYDKLKPPKGTVSDEQKKAIEKAAAAYQSLTTSIREKIEEAKLEDAAGADATESQKAQIKFTQELASGKLKLSDTQKSGIQGLLDEWSAAEKAAQIQEEYTAGIKAQDEARLKQYETVQQAVEQAQLELDTYGMGAAAITRYNIAKLEQQKVTLMQAEAGEAELEAMDRLIAKQRELLTLQNQKDDLDALFDTNKVQSFGDALRDAFGEAGNGMAQLSNALQSYLDKQDDADKARAKAKLKYAGDDKRIAREIGKIDAQQEKDRIDAYANMAGAAKGFFKENSAGYKTMQATEMAFRAWQVGEELANAAIRMGLIELITGAKVAAVATETAANVASVAPNVAADSAKASASGIAAVAKAIASLPFPLNLLAGAATVAALVGVGVKMTGGDKLSAGFNPNSAEERQKVQGTGTVLGDSTAKSESISNSLNALENYASMELGYQDSMLTALRNIETALGGAAKGIMQTAGITGGSAFGTKEYKDENTFSASKSREITDSGIRISGTFGQLRAGQGSGRQYEDVFTKSDGGMFHSGWERTDTNYANLSDAAMRPFSQIFDNMGDLMLEAGTKLGRDSSELVNAINNTTVDFGVSLRGLAGEELTAAINAGVSASFDKIVMQQFPFVARFQKMGEGLGETLVRVATEVDAVDSVFAAMGKNTQNLYDEARIELVAASGGLDKFADSAKSFMNNFYSAAEQADMQRARLAPVLAQYGLSAEGPDAQKMFRDLVVGLDTSTEAGRATYVALMRVQQAFYDVTEAASEQRADLLEELEGYVLTESGLLAKQRAALDASNRSLFDQVQQAKAMREAHDALRDSMVDSVDTFKGLASDLRGFAQELKGGSLSTLTIGQQEANARAEYERIAALAQTGDKDALGKFQDVAQKFLAISQQANGGDARYSQDFINVLAMTEKLAKYSESQVSEVQRQIDALDRQTAATEALAAILQAQASSAGAIPAPYYPPGYAEREAEKDNYTANQIELLRREMAERDAAAQKLAVDSAIANRDVTMEGARVVASAVASNAGTRRTAANTSAALDA